MNCLFQDGIKGLSLDRNCEDNFLIGLNAPTASVHHPEEVGFDPTHPGHFKFSTKKLVLGGEAAYGRAVRLIDDDPMIVKLSQDVLPFLGPPPFLVYIQFCL